MEEGAMQKVNKNVREGKVEFNKTDVEGMKKKEGKGNFYRKRGGKLEQTEEEGGKSDLNEMKRSYEIERRGDVNEKAERKNK